MSQVSITHKSEVLETGRPIDRFGVCEKEQTMTNCVDIPCTCFLLIFYFCRAVYFFIVDEALVAKGLSCGPTVTNKPQRRYGRRYNKDKKLFFLLRDGVK